MTCVHLVWPEPDRLRLWLPIDRALLLPLRPHQHAALERFKTMLPTLT